jgi:hypothetical protein
MNVYVRIFVLCESRFAREEWRDAVLNVTVELRIQRRSSVRDEGACERLYSLILTAVRKTRVRTTRELSHPEWDKNVGVMAQL